MGRLSFPERFCRLELEGLGKVGGTYFLNPDEEE